jgi:hypothetical protein
VFSEELLSLEPIGPSFLFINSAFLYHVREDIYAKGVQDALYRLNEPMFEAGFILDYFIPISFDSYAHGSEERCRLIKGLQVDVTNEHVTRLYVPSNYYGECLGGKGLISNGFSDHT